MNSKDSPSVLPPHARRVEQVFTSAVLAAMTIAVLVVLGWSMGVEVLERVHPSWASTRMNTAVGILLMGVSLLLLHRASANPRTVLVARLGAASVIVLALLTLSQDVIGWNLGIDELLVEDARPTPATSAAPNRMAPNAAIAFVLAGAAVLLHHDRAGWRGRARQVLAIVLGASSYLAIVGYLYGVSALYWIGHSTAMALGAAVAFLLLSIALLCARPYEGLVAMLTSPHLGGQLSRRLLPAVIVVPTVLGLLQLAGQRADLYDAQFGTAALIAVTVLLFGGATWWSAAVLDRLDAQRRHALHTVQLESQARERERRWLRAVLDVLPVGVFLADATGRLVEVNEAARKLWGTSAPLVGTIPEYGRYRGWRPDTGAPVRPEEWGMARVLARGEVCAPEEFEIQPFEGPRKTILNFAAAVRDREGSITGAVAVNVDISDRKRAERELRALKDELDERVRRRTAELAAANAELEAFSYSVSHDLRAPLRWVDGFARALAEDHAERLDEAGRDHVRQIRESAQHMSELIEALLTLSRITRAPLARAEVDLSQIARATASALEASDPRRRVTWEIAEGLHAEADPTLVEVILDNLLRNAWKFTRPRATARIQVGGTRQEDEQIYFVRDNGVGFDMAYADRLFRSFERLHRAEEFEGTGIGLALVKRVVQRHGGRAWVEARLHEGATCFFTLGPPEAAR
jgi:signal transduction histidine kinase